MKKSSILLLLTGIIAGLLFILTFSITNKEGSSQSSEFEIVDKINLSPGDYEVSNYEGDEDLSYNYLINPQLLSDYEFLGIGITELGDILNDYVKEQGFTSQKLEIINISQKSSIIYIEIDIGKTKQCLLKYDNLTNEFSFEI